MGKTIWVTPKVGKAGLSSVNIDSSLAGHLDLDLELDDALKRIGDMVSPMIP